MKENIKTHVEEKLKELDKPEGFCGSILLYLPSMKKFMTISFGTGDNLLREDRLAGYDDYLYISYHEWDSVDFAEIETDQMMFNQADKSYKDIADAVADAMEYAFDDMIDIVPLQYN